MSDNEILEAAGFTNADEVRQAVALVNAAKLLHPLGFLTADEVRECIVNCELAFASHATYAAKHSTGFSRNHGIDQCYARTNHGEPDLDDHEFAQFQNDNLAGFSHLMMN